MEPLRDSQSNNDAILTAGDHVVIEAIPEPEQLLEGEVEGEIQEAELQEVPEPVQEPQEDHETAWNWFTNLRTNFVELQHVVEKSNKKIKEDIDNSNRVLKGGWDALVDAPDATLKKIKQRRVKLAQLAEERDSEHWKHEKKLIMKYESLDYVTIYNKSYRKELNEKFFDVTGEYEWLRWVLSAVIGILIGIIAYIAHFGIQNLQEYKYEVIMDPLFDINFGLALFVYWLINVAFAAIAALLAVYYEPTAAGSGIPEVKAYLNGTKIPGFFRMRTLWVKLISMIFANAASLQVGAEGPMIHIGALIGNAVSQAQSKGFNFKIPFMKHFRNDKDKRDFITSGAGAGVAAAFGAPMGGTLFSLEEVASFWSTLLTWRTFFLCMIAVFTMKLFLVIESQTMFDSGFMIFNVGTSATSYKYQELIPFVIIGVIGGLLGALFTIGNLKVTAFRGAKINKDKRYRVLEVMAIATVSSFLQFLLPFIFPCKPLSEAGEYHRAALVQHYCPKGYYNDLASVMFTSNEHTIFHLLTVHDAGRLSFGAVLVFFVFYFCGSMYTAGSGISSGTFVPMIVVGSAYGRMVGLVVRLMFPTADPGIYAIMGAAAFMAGVSRLTVSLTVILIEITNDLANLLPLMLVVMTAKWVADPIIHPFFDKLIEMKHIPYLEPNPTKEMKLLQCRHIMARKPKYFKEKEKIGKILLILKDCTHNGFPIVNDDKNRRVKGLILRTQLVVLLDRLSQIWVDKTDLEYSHQNYQTRLAWTLPPFNEIFNRFDPQEDYNREIDLTPFINLTVVSVNTEFAVSEAYTIFRTMGLRHLPVVDENNKLKGMITKKDLLEHNCKEIYLLLKRIKETDINKDMVTDDDSPLTSPRVLSPAASRRPSPTHSRVASRRTSPSVSRRNSFTNLRGSGPHARSPPIPVAIQDAHK